MTLDRGPKVGELPGNRHRALLHVRRAGEDPVEEPPGVDPVDLGGVVDRQGHEIQDPVAAQVRRRGQEPAAFLETEQRAASSGRSWGREGVEEHEHDRPVEFLDARLGSKRDARTQEREEAVELGGQLLGRDAQEGVDRIARGEGQRPEVADQGGRIDGPEAGERVRDGERGHAGGGRHVAQGVHGAFTEEPELLHGREHPANLAAERFVCDLEGPRAIASHEIIEGVGRGVGERARRGLEPGVAIKDRQVLARLGGVDGGPRRPVPLDVALLLVEEEHRAVPPNLDVGPKARARKRPHAADVAVDGHIVKEIALPGRPVLEHHDRHGMRDGIASVGQGTPVGRLDF